MCSVCCVVKLKSGFLPGCARGIPRKNPPPEIKNIRCIQNIKKNKVQPSTDKVVYSKSQSARIKRWLKKKVSVWTVLKTSGQLIYDWINI